MIWQIRAAHWTDLEALAIRRCRDDGADPAGPEHVRSPLAEGLGNAA